MTVLKVKSGAGGTWEEVGGVGIGVPAGGSTGAVLTKSSAADYATAWTTTPTLTGLTVTGGVVLADQQVVQSSAGYQIILPWTPAGVVYFAHNCVAQFNGAGGDTLFSSNVSVSGTIFKGGVAYTHPDHILESWATGRIEKFREAPGARDYEGLRPLADVEASIREHWRLPRHIRDGTYDVFRRGDELLASLEEAYLYLIDHAHRLKALEDTVRRAEP